MSSRKELAFRNQILEPATLWWVCMFPAVMGFGAGLLCSLGTHLGTTLTRIILPTKGKFSRGLLGSAERASGRVSTDTVCLVVFVVFFSCITVNPHGLNGISHA